MLKLVRRPKSPFWIIRGTVTVWRQGRAVSESIERSTRTDCRREAEGILQQFQASIAQQNITGQAPEMTFGEAAAAYLKRGGDHRFLTRILDEYENRPLSALTQERLDEDGLKLYSNPSTRRRQWHGPILAILAGQHISGFSRPPAGGKRTYWLRPAEAEAVIGYFRESRYRGDAWGAALVTFLFGQGTRLGETLAIDAAGDLFLDYGYAVLRNPKNGHERSVTLTARTIAALSTLPNLNRPGPLFRRYDGRPWTARRNRGGQLHTRFANAVTAACLDPQHFTPHACRHSWAVWFYSATKDVVQLKQEGGWRSAEWERYTHLSSPAIAAEAERYGWGFSGERALPAIHGTQKTAGGSTA